VRLYRHNRLYRTALHKSERNTPLSPQAQTRKHGGGKVGKVGKAAPKPRKSRQAEPEHRQTHTPNQHTTMNHRNHAASAATHTTEASAAEVAFVLHFLRLQGDGTLAVLSAGLTTDRTRAPRIAARLLRRPRVQRFIQELSASFDARRTADIRVESVVVETAEVEADPAPVSSPDTPPPVGSLFDRMIYRAAKGMGLV